MAWDKVRASQCGGEGLFYDVCGKLLCLVGLGQKLGGVMVPTDRRSEIGGVV